MMKKTLSASRAKYSVSVPAEDKIFYAVTFALLSLFLVAVLYPLIFIVSASFSSPAAVSTGKVMLLPVDFNLTGYKAVFSNENILLGYRNTLFYTAVGTSFNVVVTMLAAYPLSRRDLPGRNGIMFLFAFTMLFGGGLIPFYMLVRNLNMVNTVWALILPGAMSVYNMIIARTSIQSNIPGELLEAARIDGCGDIKYLTAIVLPLSKATLAVIALFYAVGHWNAYFNAFLFINDRKLYPLQLFLREILVNSFMDNTMLEDPEVAAVKQGLAELVKYALIIVSTVPVLMIYPFIQKYFVKGVMIGSIKG